MIRKVLWVVICILMSGLVFADLANLYQQDSLVVDLLVNSTFDLIEKGDGAVTSEVSTKLLIVPQDDFRQKVTRMDTEGDVDNSTLLFEWSEPEAGSYDFGYRAVIRTRNEREEVRTKIAFPLAPESILGFEEYLKATPTIDSDNRAIVAKASELATGETDLFKVSFNLANWVGENVRYDLNSLTEKASQKASWVLENQEGVCDEMTSLFVAMARSLGIPARFVSGVSYTNSPLFSEHWQPHGLAEVYFGERGGVSFDIAFGEYGYVDVTHIKLRDGFDPQEAATQYEWKSHNVDLKARPLNFNVKITQEGEVIAQEIELSDEILDSRVGLGSYNLIKGIVKNRADYYTAATLQLAIPTEVEIIGVNKRTVMLAPKEVRETFWIVKVRDSLSDDFEYRFPTLIYSEKNVTVRDVFVVSGAENVYSRQDIEQRTVQDEEKSYSRKVTLACDYSARTNWRSSLITKCSLKNSGNVNLENLEYCVVDECEHIDLAINQNYQKTVTLPTQKLGWNSFIARVENDLVEKRMSFEYEVFDAPDITSTVMAPTEATLGESFAITTRLEKKSYAVPRKIKVELAGVGMVQEWSLDQLPNTQDLTLKLETPPLAWTNTFTLKTSWEDEKGEKFEEEQEFVIKGQGQGFLDSVKMFFNVIGQKL